MVNELINTCIKKFGYEFPVVLKHSRQDIYYVYFLNGSMIHCGITTEMVGASSFINIFHNIKTYPEATFDFLVYCIEINKMEIAESGGNRLYKIIPFSYFVTQHEKFFTTDENLIIKYCQDFQREIKFSELSERTILSDKFVKMLSTEEITERIKANKIIIKTIDQDDEQDIKKRSQIKKKYTKKEKPDRTDGTAQGRQKNKQGDLFQ